MNPEILIIPFNNVSHVVWLWIFFMCVCDFNVCCEVKVFIKKMKYC